MEHNNHNKKKHANISVFVPHNGCPHTCSFCNQRTISGHSAQPTPEDVTRTLADDLERLEQRGGDHHGRELAFFGGSFTAIDRDYMTSLLAAAQPFVGRSISGIRCSTRPDCIDDEVLSLLKEYSVTAVELGAQSMDDRVLEMNKRGHTAAQVEEASRLIHRHGIELGLQMMTGLYGDSTQKTWQTAIRLAELRPATVRIYPTVVLRGTELARLYEAGEYVPQTVEQAVEECTELMKLFERHGIRVIRLGLHASNDVEENYLAGAYHPALRELCQSRVYFQRMLDTLSCSSGERVCGFAVHPSELSKALGQHRCNIDALRQHMDDPVIRADAQLLPGEIRVIYKQ